ncbi:MAG TPA: hypothetical protein VH986_11750 [Acidimicrobiia bacterium]|jgi:hypothetical protein
MSGGSDFAPVWYDPDTTGDSNIVKISGKGVEWYLDGARRYAAGTWPTKPFTFFDESGAVIELTTQPVPLVPNPCTECPSTGGEGTPSRRSS